ncbi:MAG: TrkA family potassium uptake protein [Myxococcota bacterium]
MAKRVTFVGASPLALQAVKSLGERGHDVVLIEVDPEVVERLSDELDCGLVTGDGSRPAVLQEIGPRQTDFLFCVSDRDETNILAALVGRSLGFGRVVPKVEDPDLEPLCNELGLDDVIVPDREVAYQLTDLVEGRESPALSTVVRSGLRFFGFRVATDVPSPKALDLPAGARPIARTRGERSILIDDETELQAGDHVVVIVEEDVLDSLRERFAENGSPDRKPSDRNGERR